MTPDYNHHRFVRYLARAFTQFNKPVDALNRYGNIVLMSAYNALEAHEIVAAAFSQED